MGTGEKIWSLYKKHKKRKKEKETHPFGVLWLSAFWWQIKQRKQCCLAACFGTVRFPACERKLAGWSQAENLLTALPSSLLTPDLYLCTLSHLLTGGAQT